MMRSKFGLFVLIVSLAGAVGSEEARLESEGTVKVEKDLVFAEVDGEPLKLDLYLPEDVEAPPLVVWIHGGGWRAGSKEKPAIREVARRGYALASISYRFTDKAIFPAQIHDCKAAIRWLRGHAEEYGYSAERISVAGGSAGGHLALLLGVSSDEPRLEGRVGGHFERSSSVQAVIDYYGPSDFVLRGQTQPERAYTTKSGSYALLGGVRNGGIDPQLEKLASPAHHVSPGDPPLLVFHGVDDRVVLMDQSERIVDIYRETGLDARLIVVDEAGHGGRKFFVGEPLEAAVSFLNRVNER